MKVNKMGILKMLEHIVLCLGLTYVSYQCWNESISSEAKGQPPVYRLLLTGICVPLVLCFYYLESRFNQFDKWIYKSRLRSNGGSHGLWCTILLPLCLILSRRNGELIASGVYSAVVRGAPGLLFTSLMWIFYAKRNGSESRSRYVAYLFSSVSISALCYGCGDSFSFLIGCLMFLTFDYVINRLLAMAPRSFTLGEAIVVAQGVSTFCISAFLVLTSKFFHFKYPEDLNMNSSPYEVESRQVVEFVIISLVGCSILILSLVVFKRLRSAFGFYLMSATIAVVFIFPFLYFSLERNPLFWIGWFFTVTNERLVLLCVWVVFIAISILIVNFRPGTSTTVVRKYFHAVIVIVYILGIIIDHLLLFYTSSLVVGVFCLIECMRLLNIPPLGTAIQNGFASFLDEKDLGPLVVSNIYLLIGCSLPLWLVPYFIHDDLKPTSLAPFAGVITIGIGDTVASVGGTLFGRQKWPGTKKTLVGTFLAILSQIFACYLLISLGFVNTSVLKCVFPIIVSSLLEAFTLQIDNLILPIFFYLMLC